ncbi:MAG: glutamine-hydrolyzing GMP synthase, partial [Candidatus Hadarchaeum sp.]
MTDQLTVERPDSDQISSEEAIAILDFGSQYSQLIARRVRECNVYCQIFRYDDEPAVIQRFAPAGFILSGGPASVYDDGAPRLPAYLLEMDKPILGICYGMQLLAYELGGHVQPATRREYGPADLSIRDSSDPLFHGLPPTFRVWMSHGDQVLALPPGFLALASTASASIAAFGDEKRRIYGLQFHPEVIHTAHGIEILRNFLYRICGCRGTWQPAAFITRAIASIREQVGSGKAIVALSGGVDSTVAATLVHKAIGERLTGIFVNHGLLRLGEAEHNLEVFRRHLGLHVIYVDVAERFLEALRGISDPEEKRRIIGHEFIRVFEAEARKCGDVQFLVQGTLYPDVIESHAADTRAAARIKTHHNVGGLPAKMDLALIEPLRYLFKDEVRRIGKELGLPDEIVYRQPFPGPGLAVRIIGEVTRERLDVLRAADAIVTSEIATAGLGGDIWQYFAVLTPIRSVGVMGDGRTYAHVVAVRAVVSEDG